MSVTALDIPVNFETMTRPEFFQFTERTRRKINVMMVSPKVSAESKEQLLFLRFDIDAMELRERLRSLSS